jgi:hypothetical protein
VEDLVGLQTLVGLFLIRIKRDRIAIWRGWLMWKFIRQSIISHCLKNCNRKICQYTLLLIMTKQEADKLDKILKLIETQRKFNEVCIKDKP